jgi:two-component system response regulator PrrA
VSRTVLVVEDDAVTREHFTRFLKLEGYTVVSASDAAAALSVVTTRAPDAILLDFHLPLTDGLQCLRQLRQAVDHPIPVAIVTGDYFLSDAQIAEIESLGARLWYKPLFLDQLLELVRALFAAST